MEQTSRPRTCMIVVFASAAVCVTSQAMGGVTVFRVKQGVCGTQPVGINDLGTVTGDYFDASGNSHGFLRDSNGTITIFDPAGSIETEAQAVSSKGTVVGQYMDNNYNSHGFIRSRGGTITSFDARPQSSYTNAIAIDGNGTIVGQYAKGQGWLGFKRLRDGRIRNIRVSGAFDSDATAINNSGLIAGGYSISRDNPASHGFVRDATGVITTFDADGAINTYAIGIDGKGDAAGYYEDGNTILHSFLRQADGTILEFDPPGAIGSTATGINARGEIAGYYGTGLGEGSFVRTTDGTFTEFNIRESTGTIATGINGSGAVTGYFENKNDISAGFIWGTSGGRDLSGDKFMPPASPLPTCDSERRYANKSR